MRIDLHLHSSASDGRLSPAELVRQAAQIGMDIIAMTDHDSVEGVAPALEAARAYPSLKVVPGVEINTDVPHGEVHILGYFIDYNSTGLRDRLGLLQESRLGRARRMVDKLHGLGLNVDWDRVLELAAGGAVGRPHVAQALLEAGYISDLREAFDRYIGREGPAYVERLKLSPMEAVKLVVEARGLPVLAHPADIPNLDNMLSRLSEVGLVGLEAYYGEYPGETVRRLVGMARRYGLLTTGGSDFHGPESTLPTPMGSVFVPWEPVKRLLSLAWEKSCPGAFVMA